MTYSKAASQVFQKALRTPHPQRSSTTMISICHCKQLLWHHILLNVHVTPRDLRVLVNGIVPKDQHRCSRGKIAPFGSLTSDNIRLTSSSPGLPVFLLWENLNRANYNEIKHVEHTTQNKDVDFHSMH